MSTARSVLLGAALVAATALASAIAVATPAEDAERARLAQERAAIESTYSARIAECQRRFVVTSCVEDTKRDRRHGLDALRSRQIAIDEARRKERSEARRSELAANAAEQAKRDAARPSRRAVAASEPATPNDEPKRTLEPRRPTVERASASERRGASASSGAKQDSAADRAAKESRSRATFAARKQQAAEHREEAIEKAAKRMEQRPPAASLPVPKEIRKEARPAP